MGKIGGTVVVIERTQETDFIPVSMILLSFLTVMSYQVADTLNWFTLLNRFRVQCSLIWYSLTVVSVYWVGIYLFTVTMIHQYQELLTGVPIQGNREIREVNWSSKCPHTGIISVPPHSVSQC